jgi:hypothetical protein
LFSCSKKFRKNKVTGFNDKRKEISPYIKEPIKKKRYRKKNRKEIFRKKQIIYFFLISEIFQREEFYRLNIKKKISERKTIKRMKDKFIQRKKIPKKKTT